jgi:cytochrome c oxidase subunit 2
VGGSDLPGLRRGTPAERRGRRARWALGGLAVALPVLAGCSAEQVGELRRLGLPESASDRAPYIHDLWIGSWIAAGLVGLLVWGLIGWAALRYKRRHNELPKQNRYNLPMEIMYTFVPFVIVGALFYFTVVAQNQVLAKVPEPDHTIDVVGQKWSWTFNYREAQNAAVGADVWDAGTIENTPNLYLPVGETVRFNLSSPDVIHSFWIPSFYQKLDVVPGRHNSFDVTPNKEGVFRGKCAELCGTYHSAMLFNVHIVSVEEYNAHLNSLEAAGQTGVAKGPLYANEARSGQDNTEPQEGENADGEEGSR